MEKPEEFYKLNVLEALREILDLSGLILDLSYAAVLYDNKEIALKVIDLKRYVDRLTDTLIMHMSLAVRDRDDAEKSLSVFKASNIANQISEAATEIAKITLRKLKLHPKLVEALLETDETVEIFTLGDESRLSGYNLEETRMRSAVGFDVIAIKRDYRWIINPEDEFQFAIGDVVVVRGTKDALDQLILHSERG